MNSDAITQNKKNEYYEEENFRFNNLNKTYLDCYSKYMRKLAMKSLSPF